MRFQLTYASGAQIVVESDTGLAHMRTMYAPSVDILPLASDSPAEEVAKVVESKPLKKRKATPTEANDK